MTPPAPGPVQRERLRRSVRLLWKSGYRFVAGADEAGAGPLAGPLVAAAVILTPGSRLPGVNDSKQLLPAEREHWAVEIKAHAAAWSIVEVSAAEVDEIGPYQGSIVAMTRAVLALHPSPDYLLTDARRLPDVRVPQQAVIRGDATHLVIAAASVLAKAHRDARMVELDALHPGYGFAQHKGYGTQGHLAALRERGPCPEHRRSYAPVRDSLSVQLRLEL